MEKTLEERFEAFEDEFLKFERIEKPLHSRPDICAFLMLHELDPGARDIVGAAEHDEIFLNFDCDKLNGAPEEFIRDLNRCGVGYDDENNSLFMFV